MRVLSASEAVSPAIDRTKAVLFKPFRFGRSWKLAATAYLSVMGLLFIPTPLSILLTPARGGGAFGAFSWLFASVFAILFSLVMFLFFYLGSRLQFVLFAFVLEGKEMIAPLWGRYRAPNWRWLGLKLILSVAACVVFGIPIGFFFRSFLANLPVQPGQPASPQMLSSLLLLYAFILLPLFVVMLLSSLLSDFVLPSIALEDATLSDALGRFLQLIKTEPLQMFAFIAFKVLLAIAGAIAMEIAIIVGEIVAAIPLGLLAFLGSYLFRSSGPLGHMLMVAGAITLGLIFIAFLFYVSLLVVGTVHIFFQAYALYFLGGRYPLLGDLLEPPSPDFIRAEPVPPGVPPAPVLS
jgi:hypothetical protein